jgi:hypothetical protein
MKKKGGKWYVLLFFVVPLALIGGCKTTLITGLVANTLN